MAAVEHEPLGPISERAELHRALGRLQELRQRSAAASPREPRAVRGSGRQPIDRATLPAVAAWARHRHAALPRLAEWIDARSVLRELETAGLGGFVEALTREAPSADLWVDAFLKPAVHPLADLALRAGAAAGPVPPRRTTKPRWRSLRRLDRRPVAHRLGADLGERLLAQRPSRQLPGMQRQSEVGLLLREARKQRRFKPLRRLFAELPTPAAELKPCLLMSPLAVAQYLGESAVTFDLVIFDEARRSAGGRRSARSAAAGRSIVVGDRAAAAADALLPRSRRRATPTTTRTRSRPRASSTRA